jgi:hypothetical protein
VLSFVIWDNVMLISISLYMFVVAILPHTLVYIYVAP